MIVVLLIFAAIYAATYYNYKKSKEAYANELHRAQSLEELCGELSSELKTVKSEKDSALCDLNTISEQAGKLTAERNELKESLLDCQARIRECQSYDRDVKNYDQAIENYQKALNSLQSNIDSANEEYTKAKDKKAAIQKEIDILKEDITSQQYEIERAKAECAQNLQTIAAESQSAKDTLAALEKEIERYKSIQSSIVENNKREEQKRQDLDFYRLQLSSSDIKEIKQLKEAAELLRDPEPLYKVIWSYYYSKAYSDLVGRVFNGETPSGIYKITNVKTQKCYVGQSINVPERWRQHVKRGIGAEKATKNKLYPEMMEIGPESFTFEFLEECPKEKLDAQEDFWQDFYKAKEFGYSIK